MAVEAEGGCTMGSMGVDDGGDGSVSGMKLSPYIEAKHYNRNRHISFQNKYDHISTYLPGQEGSWDTTY